jgi:hypothetical protein
MAETFYSFQCTDVELDLDSEEVTIKYLQNQGRSYDFIQCYV